MTLNPHLILATLCGILVGLAGRIWVMFTEHRQFPTVPHGMIIHFMVGLTAAVVGSLEVGAIVSGNVTAAVFLGLGMSQFHNIRQLESSYMAAIDRQEIVQRGAAYIQGMATAFAARDFLVFIVAAVTTVFAAYFNFILGIAAGVAATLLLRPLNFGLLLSKIAIIEPASVHLEGGKVEVSGIELLSFAREDEQVVKRGRGFVLRPLHFNGWMSLRHSGQQQAIRHALVQKFGHVPPRTSQGAAWPASATSVDHKKVAFFFVPEVELDDEEIVAEIADFPVLDTAFVPRRAIWFVSRPLRSER